MNSSRLEAFSDGVVDLAALAPVLPRFLSCVLSFIYVGIYWNNHHHLLLVAAAVASDLCRGGRAVARARSAHRGSRGVLRP
jgi:uncharacterized membrane protein